MILTVTPNPSIDRTVALASALTRGAVHRVRSVTNEPGGKGVNVARALQLAGLDAVALLPAAAHDPLIVAMTGAGIPFRCVPVDEPVRTNIAVTEPDGTTTKLNEPGATLDATTLARLTDAVVGAAEDATWVVLSGSLPPGVPEGWYAEVVGLLTDRDCRIAVDTSEGPLSALADEFGRAAPDLIKPNAEELAGLVGESAELLERAAAEGDPGPAAKAAQRLVDRGVGAVLATLGAAGAVLVDGTGSWLAVPPPVTPRSTVGAGDASLAGYLRAHVAGAEPPRRLRMAVAYGSAAAALPGSAMPAPARLDLDAVRVTTIAPTPTSS
ncbi:1-phosphofructokinase family hexose kinase [Mycobacterium sp. B14F4]|uniref:1-phosphofructokinase family hexose kinase n=1 Tax=Mycobacterium sp. B14F4 TaxID=3153565 RepID=UPI00325E25D1